MSYNCPSCKVEVKNNDDSICCDKCNKWVHCDCSKLSQSAFSIYCQESSFEWICEACTNDFCYKCKVIFRYGKSICCDHCYRWFHLKCSRLNNETFQKLSNSTNSWHCPDCNNHIFPFNSIDNRKLDSLSFNTLDNNMLFNKLCTLNVLKCAQTPATLDNYLTNCSICSKHTKPETSIPCPSCSHLIHKKSSKLTPYQLSSFKRNLNLWECPTCMEDKFPFSSTDDDFLHINSFNSNWSCQCKSSLPLQSKTNSEFKLLLTQSNESTFCSSDVEFDHQFNTHYSLKPDFKYYETHDFHNLKGKIKNTFSLLHTNIPSLQYNGDSLKLLLTNIEFKFDIIAVTEIWNPEYSSHSFNPPILNGYNNYSGKTGSTLKGGCGFYINKDLKSLEPKDLNVKVKENDCEMETCWIEIVLGKQPNRLSSTDIPLREMTSKQLKS